MTVLSYKHDCGMTQLNISQGQGYSAVVVVKTPVTDDSGVAHGIEHLVFRASQQFPSPLTLFQLTALTDLKINASTLADTTIYHCQSACKTQFELGLKYLLCGLNQPIFSTKDLSQEIAGPDQLGVIRRELLGGLSLGDEQLQYDVAVCFEGEFKCYQHGGDLKHLAKLSVEQFEQYHRQYYQWSSMTIVTNNVKPKWLKQLLATSAVKGAGASYCAKVELNSPLSSQPTGQRLVARWLIEQRYFGYIQGHYQQLKLLLAETGTQLLKPNNNLNQQGCFSLNVLLEHHLVEKAEQLLNDYFKQHCPVKGEIANEWGDQVAKFSSEIKQLLGIYRERNCNQASLPMLCLDAVTTLVQPQPQPINVSLSKSSHPIIMPFNNQLIEPLAQLSITPRRATAATTMISKLPAILEPLREQLKPNLANHATVSGFNQHHGLILTTIDPHQRYLAELVSYIIESYPSFLAPRLQGHCYALGCRWLDSEQQLILFTLFENQPAQRLVYISQILEQLSADERYINSVMPLVKNKLINYYQEDNKPYQTGIVKSFLSRLSKEIASGHPKTA